MQRKKWKKLWMILLILCFGFVLVSPRALIRSSVSSTQPNQEPGQWQDLQDQPLEALASGENFSSPIGVQKTLVIPMKFQEPWTKAFHCPDPNKPCFQSFAAFGPPRHKASEYEKVLNSTVNEYYLEVTYGLTSFDFDVLINPSSPDGWWTFPHKLQEYLVGAQNFVGDPGVVRDAVEQIATKAIDLTPYDRIVVIENLHDRGGQAIRSPVYYQTKNGLQPFTAALVQEGKSDEEMATVLAHELGHQLGLPDLYGTCTFPPLGGCEKAGQWKGECMGPWDLMAWDQYFAHFGAWSKVNRGWIPASLRVVDLPLLTNPFDQAFRLRPLARPFSKIDDKYALRIPITLVTTAEGTRFTGYYVECRKKIGKDGNLPTWGVVVTYIDESGREEVRALRDQQTPLEQAVLYPTQVYAKPSLGLAITHLYPTEPTTYPQGDCEVRVEYLPVRGCPDVAIYPGDIWVDSPMNEYDKYPDDQPLDSEGVPQGPGDPPWNHHDNIIRFRVRNISQVPAFNVKVKVSVAQPDVVFSCKGVQTKEVDTVNIARIDPGHVVKDFVSWIPQLSLGKPVLIRVELIHAEDEISTENNQTELLTYFTYHSPQSRARELGLFYINCDKFHPIPIRIPPRWITQIRPDYLKMNPNGRRPITITLGPSRLVRVGESARIALGIFQPSGDTFAPVGQMEIRSYVANPATLTCFAPGAPTLIGTPAMLTGTLSPGMAGKTVALDYIPPSGDQTTRLAETDTRGGFRDTFTPNQPGRWTVKVFLQGDKDVQPAESFDCSLNVACPQPTLNTISSPIDMPYGTTQTIPLSVGVSRAPCHRFTFSVSPQVGFVKLTDNGNGTASLRLSPAESDFGTHVVTVKVTDNSSPPQSASQQITIRVFAP